MQIISNDKRVRSVTVHDLQEINSQSLSIRAKKKEQLVPMMPAFKNAFDLMGDDIVELSTKNDNLENQIGDFDQKWSEESKAEQLRQIDDKKRPNLIMSRLKKRMNKH